MVYVVETDVNRFGYLYGEDDPTLALETARHHWTVPFPALPNMLELHWERGTSRVRPNVFHHNLLRDFVCDLETYRFLQELVPGDLHLVANGRCAGLGVAVLQVVRQFDVVDPLNSVPYEYAAGGISFPHVPLENEAPVQGHIFRAPNPGLSLTVLVADDVMEAIEARGVRGWRFERALVAE